MDDLYDKWNRVQKELSRKTSLVFFHEREIWWCSIGMNIGRELFGKNELFERPVLILKVYNKETALIIPLTSKLKDGKYYITLEFKGRFSTITLSQARTISTKRLSRKIGIISKNNFCVVRKKFIESI